MKIAIVNDVAVVAEAMRQIVISTHEHQVAWIASSGDQAVSLCAANRPDLILMNLIMPDMDGAEATRQIMQNTPCAILILTASPASDTDCVNHVFRALGAGAIDVTATSAVSGSFADHKTLLAKIKMLDSLIKASPTTGIAAPLMNVDRAAAVSSPHADTLIVIGASAGGPLALAKILSCWTPDESTSAVLVQHIDREFTSSLAKWLSQQIDFPLEIIEDGCCLTAGKVYIAKTNDHLVFDENYRLGYTAVPRDYPYRPSIDVFFNCVARHWRKQATGVLLTGVGRDGAEGLLALRRMGKFTIAQDQATSAVYGMPRAAVELDAADLILPLEGIGPMLSRRTGAGASQALRGGRDNGSTARKKTQ